MAVVGEETRDQLAVRGQPGSRTAEAERFRDRGDHAYISASVRELEIHGGSALLIPARQSQRIPGLDHFQNFLLGNHPAGLPLVRVAHVHIFDETDVKSILSGEFHEVENLVVVDAAFDHGVDLDRQQANALGDRKALEHRSQVPA